MGLLVFRNSAMIPVGFRWSLPPGSTLASPSLPEPTRTHLLSSPEDEDEPRVTSLYSQRPQVNFIVLSFEEL